MSKIEEFIDTENLYATEGRRGLTNLCTIVRAIGYKDPQYFGQLDGRSSIGDLVEFLEDNSGAIEALMNWIIERDVPEWEAAVSYDNEE